MVERPHQRELLTHPVISCFINIHYLYCALFYFITVCIYAFPLLELTHDFLFPSDVPQHYWMKLSFMWSFNVIYDFVIRARMDVFKYLCTLEYYLSLPMVIFVFGVIFDIFYILILWFQLPIISFLLAWLRLVVMTGRFPLMAVQMEMFKGASFTCLKCLAGYSILLITLTLPIFIIFERGSEKVLSLLSTIFTPIRASEFSSERFYLSPITSHVILFLFFFPGIVYFTERVEQNYCV